MQKKRHQSGWNQVFSFHHNCGVHTYVHLNIVMLLYLHIIQLNYTLTLESFSASSLDRSVFPLKFKTHSCVSLLQEAEAVTNPLLRRKKWKFTPSPWDWIPALAPPYSARWHPMCWNSPNRRHTCATLAVWNGAKTSEGAMWPKPWKYNRGMFVQRH